MSAVPLALESAENRFLTAMGTSATLVFAMSIAGKQFSVSRAAPMNRPGAILLLILLVAAVVAAGCHTVDVRATADPRADFSVYRTYNFSEPFVTAGSPDIPEQNRLAIEAAIRGEMEKRACRLADQPDLLLSIRLETADKTYDKSSPAVESGSLRANVRKHYDLIYEEDARTQRVVNYTEGTLRFDALDRKQDRLVWEGIAMGVLKRDQTDEQRRQRIHEAVKTVFDKFPISPSRN